MKKIFAVLLAILMIAFQIPASAVVDVEIDLSDLFDNIEDIEDYDGVLVVSDTAGSRGDVIEVRVALATNVKVNSIGISGLEYDEDILTFIGFSDYDEFKNKAMLCQFDDAKATAVAAFGSSQKYSGNVCTLNFVVNDDAPIGETYVTFNNIQLKNSSELYGCEVYEGTVVVIGEDVPVEPVSENIVEISNAYASAGDEVSVEVYLETEDAINTIGISGLEYDEDILTFTGFSDYEYLQSKSMLCHFDEAKKTGVAALNSIQTFSGLLCNVNFVVNDNAPSCETVVNFSDIQLKNGSEVYDYTVFGGTLTIEGAVPSTGSYVVKHYFENRDGSYTLDSDYTETYTDIESGTEVFAERLNINGYEFDEYRSVVSGIVNEGETLVLELYYNLLACSVYFYDSREELYEFVLSEDSGYVIDESDIPEPDHDGYIFIGWSTLIDDPSDAVPTSYFDGRCIDDIDGNHYYAQYRSENAVTSNVLEISDAEAYVGSDISLAVYLETSDAINTIGMSDLEFDEDVLTFTGFTVCDYLANNSLLCQFDNAKMTCVAALNSIKTLDGQICFINFTVNEDAPIGETYVTFNDVVLKESSIEYDCTVEAGKVNVEFQEIAVRGVSLDENDVTLEVGQSQTLIASITPSNATNKNVTWTTSDRKVVTVSGGVLKAVGEGEAVVTVTTQDGQYTDECVVTVTERNFDNYDAVYTFSDAYGAPGKMVSVDVYLSTEKDFNTLGLANITFDNSIMEYVNYTANPSVSNKFMLFSVITNNNSLVFSAASATGFNGLDDKILTLNFKIKEDAQKNSSTTITALPVVKQNATSYEVAVVDGLVEVSKAVTDVVLNKNELSLVKGASETLTATVSPSDAYDKSVTWKSSNTSVATVSASGKVTAVGGGSATITVTTNDGGFTDECEVTVTVPVTGVSLNKTATTIAKGKTETLVATVNPSDADNKNVTWTSSNNSVVTVNKGVVTAVGKGTATVTVKTVEGNFTASCTVTVNVPVTGVALNKNSVSLVKGKTETLTATVTPSDANNKSVTWTSSNTSVAVVSNGKITAIGGGSAIITVTTNDGGFTDECEVTVIVPVTGISLNKTSTTIARGKTETLLATVNPSDATNKNVTWTSSNNNVVTVENGVVTAVGKGTATVTAKTEDGGFSAKCTVTVNVPVTGVSLNKNSLEIVKGKTETLTASVLPSDADNKTVTWKSSNTAVATVSNGKITAVNGGTATITVTTKDGGFTDECEVTVVIPVTGISLDKKSAKLNKGENLTLTATVSPSNATYKDVEWSSSDENVLTVEDGIVTAVGKGTAKVIATTVYGGFKAECTIEVLVPVAGVVLDDTTIEMLKGDEHTLIATVLPEEANDKSVVWASSNEEVATVENGVVKAVGKGSAEITVTTNDGGYQETCFVTVIVPVESVTLNETFLNLTVNDAFVLVPTVNPEDASDTSVVWSTSDDSVATVEDGVVTARAEGIAIVTVTTNDGGKTAACAVRVNPEEPKAFYTLSDVSAREGTDITVTVSLSTEETFNTLGLANITYDEEVLTYTGFEIDDEFASKFFICDFDEEKFIFSAATSEAFNGYDGEVIKLNFTVNEGAPIGTTFITAAGAKVKMNHDEIAVALEDAQVTVIDQILGDINLDEVVDMNDAILLLQHSMFPDLIQIGYKGSIDFNRDGFVDMNDAILLLQHSMFPDLIPLG